VSSTKAKVNGNVRKANLDPLFSNTTKAIVWGMQTKVNHFITKKNNNPN